MNSTDFSYNCVASSDQVCAEEGVSLEACDECVVQTAQDGPWGDFMDVLMRRNFQKKAALSTRETEKGPRTELSGDGSTPHNIAWPRKVATRPPPL